MSTELRVTVVNQYGCKVVYPECETAKLLADLAGTRTLTPEAIATIKKLGYTLRVVQQEEFL